MIISKNIGLSSSGKVAFLSMSGDPNQNEVTQPRLDEVQKVNPWAEWGEGNNLPILMSKDIEQCGVLASAIDGKARFGLGRGVKPFIVTGYDPSSKEEILEPVNNPEIEDWLDETNMFEQCFGLLKDNIGFANWHGRFKFNNAGDKIGLFVRDDVTEFRYQREDDKGQIAYTYLCSDWGKSPKESDKTLIKTPLLPRVGTAQYLMNLTPEQRRAKEFAITGRNPSWQKHYYPLPTWYSAKKWVDIAKGVPDMKAAMFENNIRIKYVVTILDSYWVRTYGGEWQSYTNEQRDTKRTELYQSIDNWLTGSKNAYKSIFVPGVHDPISGKVYEDIIIKTIDDNTKQGELLPDSAAANSEILFALMMNPALMGADTPGGPYSGGAGSGSNIREAALVQVMIQEFERQQISRILNIVKKVNGWPANIVWRFPGLVLTTLDTGGSTKNVNTGG